MVREEVKMKCEICGRDFKGKIGIGVHLKRSHTSEERARLFLRHITDTTPLLLVVLILMGLSQSGLSQSIKEVVNG